MKLRKEESELLSLLPKKRNADSVYIQGYIPKSLYAEVSKNMDEDGLKWADLLTASLTVYVRARAGSID